MLELRARYDKNITKCLLQIDISCFTSGGSRRAVANVLFISFFIFLLCNIWGQLPCRCKIVANNQIRINNDKA